MDFLKSPGKATREKPEATKGMTIEVIPKEERPQAR